MSRVLLTILCCDMSHIIMVTVWLNMSIMLVTILWLDVGSVVVTILWSIELCVTYDSLKSKKYMTNSSICPLLQRMPDMSNLHEVQTVDMLPPEMNFQFQQVKLSSDAFSCTHKHWAFFASLILTLFPLCNKKSQKSLLFYSVLSLLSHHSKIMRKN
jgi:hypothetical protein